MNAARYGGVWLDGYHFLGLGLDAYPFYFSPLSLSPPHPSLPSEGEVLAAESARKSHIFGEDGDSLRMDSAEVCILRGVVVHAWQLGPVSLVPR